MTLATIGGTEPGSTFHVFATSLEVKYAVRAFVHYGDADTHMHFRVRLQSTLGPNEAMVFGRLLAKRHPNKMFSAGSYEHVSISGCLAAFHGVLRKTALLDAISHTFAIDHVFKLAGEMVGDDPKSVTMLAEWGDLSTVLLEGVANTALPDSVGDILSKIGEPPKDEDA